MGEHETHRQPAKRRRRRMLIVWILLAVVLAAALTAGILNTVVIGESKPYILSEEEAQETGPFDCILVLGCKVNRDGTPSNMLYDRLAVGVRLFDAGVSDRLLMSGDHGRTDYDEVNTMKQFAVDAGADPDEVFCDHAGFSTYESMYRARDVFCCKRILIVTQDYHLYRAVYNARRLGLDAYGVASNGRTYRGQTARDIREAAARCKDVFACLFDVKPTYLGEPIPIGGKGSLTDG